MNRVLEEMLRSFCSTDHATWDLYLKQVEFAYNNSTHESSGYTPLFLNWLQHPNVPASLNNAPRLVPTDAASVQNFTSTLARVMQHAKSCLAVARNRQKQYADRKRSELILAVGQMVMLDSRNVTLKGTGSTKLNPKFVGPFKVLRKISDVAYQIDLPAGNHDVFHVSMLKPHVDGSAQFLGRTTDSQPPPVFSKRGEKFWSFDKIVRRKARDGDDGFMVLYKGYKTPEWVARYLLIKDVPDDVAAFEAAHPLPTRLQRRGRR